jgi:sarcosine oxidase
MYWFQPDGGVEPYLPDRQPIWIHEAVDGMSLYGFPAADGPDGGVKTAIFRHGVVCTPETIDRTVHPDEVAHTAGRLEPLMPTLPGTFVRAAACMYTTTPDENFVIATHPASDRVSVACGFSGHGFKFVPVVGEILADLALEGATKHPIGLFDPDRFSSV